MGQTVVKFKPDDKVIVYNLFESEIYKEGFVIHVEDDLDLSVYVRFSDGWKWWFKEEDLVLDKSYIRDQKLNKLGI